MGLEIENMPLALSVLNIHGFLTKQLSELQ